MMLSAAFHNQRIPAEPLTGEMRLAAIEEAIRRVKRDRDGSGRRWWLMDAVMVTRDLCVHEAAWYPDDVAAIRAEFRRICGCEECRSR